jgi:AcrR family transcriptional regulator
MDEETPHERAVEGSPGVGGPDPAAEPPPSRERVLEAAARVFASNGLDAPMPAVAAAAGVGVGTIYRAFGSKEELIASLAADRIERFGQDARAALEASDAWEGFVDLLERTAERQASDYIVTEALGWTFDHPRVVEAQRVSAAATRDLIARAKEAGSLRPDFEPADLQMMFAALGAAQHATPRGSRAWTRIFTVMVDGLSPGRPSEMKDSHLTAEDIAQASKERRERRGR